MTTTSPSSGPTNSYTTLPPLISISPSAMSLLVVVCVREQLVLEREVEGDALGDLLADEPLVRLLDRLAERAPRSPADVARQLVDAEQHAVVPVVQVRCELLHQIGELVALTDRHLGHALLGLRGADVDVRAGGLGQAELEAAVPHVVDHLGGHEHLARR